MSCEPLKKLPRKRNSRPSVEFAATGFAVGGGLVPGGTGGLEVPGGTSGNGAWAKAANGRAAAIAAARTIRCNFIITPTRRTKSYPAPPHKASMWIRVIRPKEPIKAELPYFLN